MGPYYRNTSQGMGSLFDNLYENPSLMLFVIATAIGLGFYFWRRKKTDE